MSVQLLQFPPSRIDDVPRMLRHLAEGIEQGEFGDAHNIAWVIDCGNGRVECGMAGSAPEPAALGHFLFALGMKKLEDGALEKTR